MASAPKVPDVEMAEPGSEEKEKEEEERGESFYVKLLDAERKKTNGEGELDEELELSPEDMKRLASDWVGKKINLRHDLKGGFGKITAAWHTKDGKTHVRLTPGTSEAGKKAADMIKKGEITSVSAGWQVHKDSKTGDVVKKTTDHVALTNLPVYEGTVIYAMASQDSGIKPDGDGVLRTKGGLAVLPVMESQGEAAVRVDNVMVGASDGNEALERGASTAPKKKTRKKSLALDKPSVSVGLSDPAKMTDEWHEEEVTSNATELLWKGLFGFSPAKKAQGKR
jgi:hypothetical protein